MTGYTVHVAFTPFSLPVVCSARSHYSEAPALRLQAGNEINYNYKKKKNDSQNDKIILLITNHTDCSLYNVIKWFALYTIKSTKQNTTHRAVIALEKLTPQKRGN